MMFCASKTPSFRNRAGTATSKSDPLALVVWATTVTSTRSLGPAAGTLKTKHGRIFATMPRSTSQTSPRRGLAIASLSRVQVEEQLLSDSDESIVADIACFALNNLPQQQAGSLMLFRIAERLE
jgi:hypothetical protein